MHATLREAALHDAAALDGIYDHYILKTAITFDVEPWAAGQRETWLGERERAGDVVLVAELDERVVGFAWSSLYRPRAAYRTTSEVSVYLHPDTRARGIGSQLFERLLAELAQRGRHMAVGGVALPNDPSRALLTRHGFGSVGVLHEVGFKLGRYWDVELFERVLG